MQGRRQWESSLNCQGKIGSNQGVSKFEFIYLTFYFEITLDFTVKKNMLLGASNISRLHSHGTTVKTKK